jgi:phage terminase small subunit
MALLQAALESLDRAEEARLAISSAGMTTKTKTTGAVHVHPLVKVEREARGQFAKIWSDLNFGFDPAIDGIHLEKFLAQQRRGDTATAPKIHASDDNEFEDE